MDPSIFAHFKHIFQKDLTGRIPKASPTGLNKTAQLLLQPYDRQLRHTGEPCLTNDERWRIDRQKIRENWQTSKKHENFGLNNK